MTHFDIQGKWELLIVWGLSFLSFFTMSNLVAFFAIIASITTIVRNFPHMIEVIKKLIKMLKK